MLEGTFLPICVKTCAIVHGLFSIRWASLLLNKRYTQINEPSRQELIGRYLSKSTLARALVYIALIFHFTVVFYLLDFQRNTEFLRNDNKEDTNIEKWVSKHFPSGFVLLKTLLTGWSPFTAASLLVIVNVLPVSRSSRLNDKLILHYLVIVAVLLLISWKQSNPAEISTKNLSLTSETSTQNFDASLTDTSEYKFQYSNENNKDITNDGYDSDYIQLEINMNKHQKEEAVATKKEHTYGPKDVAVKITQKIIQKQETSNQEEEKEGKLSEILWKIAGFIFEVLLEILL